MGNEAHARQADVLLSRPFVFIPYVTSSIQSGGDAFELRLPAAKVVYQGAEVLAVSSASGGAAEGSYAYVFVTSESFATLPERPVWCQDAVAADTNPLYMGYRISSTGLSSISRQDVHGAAIANEFPPLTPAGKTAEFLIDSRLRYFVVGSPVPLTQAALQELEALSKKDFPTFDLLTDDFPYVDVEGPNPKYALPVLDAVAITIGLTRKYALACDKYLGHSTKLENPQLGALDKGAQTAQLELLLKGVADTLQGLRKASNVDGELDARALEKFLETYAATTETLRAAREDAAYNLIRWLEGSWMTRVESWGWKSNGVLEKLIDGQTNREVFAYQPFVDAVAHAQSRLVESDTGVTYLSQTYERAKTNADRPGVLRTLGKFVLADETPAGDIVSLMREVTTGLFGAWTAYYEVLSAHIAIGSLQTLTVKKHKVTVDAVLECVAIMLAHLRVIIGDDIVEVKVLAAVRVKVRMRATIDVIEIGYRPVQMKLLEDAKQKLEKVNVTFDRVQAAFAVLNIGLTFGALREELRKGKFGFAAWSSAFDFAESIVFFHDQFQKFESLRFLRGQLLNVPDSSRVVSQRLGLFGSVMALGGSATAAMDNYNSRDWDAAAAEAVQGVGAIMTSTGYILMIKSPGGGPTAGYWLAAGAVVSLGGLIWCAFAKDTPYDQLAKFSPFGDEAKVAHKVQAPGWALCKKTGTFGDWDPKTLDGLATYLKAAEQLFYSFRAKGAHPPQRTWAADSGLRLYPSAARPNSVFHISYKAEWVRSVAPFAGVVRTHEGKCTIELGTADDPKNPRFRDLGGHFEEAGMVTLGKEGEANVVDVTFRLLGVALLKDPLELFSLKCSVQLDVHGDGSLLVPTTDKGVKAVEVKCVENRRMPSGERASHVDDHIDA